MDVGITIIGAGVVGLAIAAEIGGENVCVLEKNRTFGLETSSRNSEVIHASLYYNPGSFKARFCAEGNALLYEICEKEGISCKKLGKLVVATDEQEERSLESLLANSAQCGISNIFPLSENEIKNMEPNVCAKRALFSPATGIIDSHGLMDFFSRKATSLGTTMLYMSKVVAIEPLAEGYRLTIDMPNQRYTFTSRAVINSSGLYSDEIAGLAGIDVDSEGCRLHYCKGDYFNVSGNKRKLVNRLVYVAPGSALSKSIHVVFDLAGQMRLGPDAEYIGREITYAVTEKKKEQFYNYAKRFLPFLEIGDLEPGTSGIRPKLSPSGNFRDFIIREESGRGLPFFINLIGIESPGLTASPAIARYVKELLKGMTE